MFGFFSRSLMNRLTILFAAGALIPIVAVASLAFYYSERALNNDVYRQLSAVNHIKKDRIISYLKGRMADLTVLANLPGSRAAIKELQGYHDAGGGDPNGPYNIESQEYRRIYQQIDPFFRLYVKTYGYYDLFFICPEHGHVMFTVAREGDLGTNLRVGPYRDSGLARLWAAVVNKKAAAMVDFSQYQPSGCPAAFMGAPVLDEKGQIEALVALQISTRDINELVQEKTGMGETGESYLVGHDLFMRSDSRLGSGADILKTRVDTDAVKRALRGETGEAVLVDYRGVKVLSSFSPLDLRQTFGVDFDWAMVSEMDEKEAIAPVRDLGWRILWTGIVIVLLSLLVGYFSARAIARPLQDLSLQVAQMARGDLSLAIAPEKRQDEVGVLVNGFRHMLSILQEQTRQIRDGTTTIASSISQISSTTSELAAASSETSTSVSEVSTTVEEVRQTAYVSNEKAERVSSLAEQAAQVSETGQKAIEATVQGMLDIKAEMDYVAESILKLSEQMQSIGDIISAVHDIADQSNLLSVNASIEAAKAGEYGKGFAVVAQEVRSMADQSKEATVQVRAILNDIQKATSAAVMATERGTKAVEKGVNLTGRSGETIQKLAESILESARSAAQIASSSQQQLIGMDQLAQAMVSIKEASMQNVEGTRQLETAVRDLKELGLSLKGLAEKFNI